MSPRGASAPRLEEIAARAVDLRERERAAEIVTASLA
jgi:hypothetical protein